MVNPGQPGYKKPRREAGFLKLNHLWWLQEFYEINILSAT
jgi:hypothetical protein